jgi:hypothetical protein
VSWLPVEEFERLYPDAEAPTNDSDFKAWMVDEPEWVKSDGEKKAVLVGEYFYKIKEAGEVIKKAGLSRQLEKTRVKWCVLSAKEVLDEADWNGQYIPLIPVIGTELQPFNGERMWEGMVRKARDAQKFFNFSISTLVERMAMEPKAPFVGAEGQFRGHEEEWMLANIRNQPYLEYRPTSHEGNLNPPPQRAQIDSSGMSVALMALDQARQFVQTATNVYAPSLGQLPADQSKQSGRAILALQQQSDAGTSHFLQNLSTISMPYEARVVLDLMPAIYDRPGRVVEVLGAEDDPRKVVLNAPFVEEQGQPKVVPPDVPPPPGAKTLNLSEGKYTVSINVGKSFQTRLQEGASEIGGILQSAPALMPMIGATYFKFRDFPGAKEIADILKQVREKQFPGLGQEEGAQPSPEQMQAQVQAMQQQMQQMGQQMQAMGQALETEQAKQQAQVLKAQLDAQTAMQKAQLESDTKLRVSAADNETKLAIAGVESKLEALLTLLKLEAEGRKIEAQAAHDDEQMARSQMHEASMTELGRPAPEKPKED